MLRLSPAVVNLYINAPEPMGVGVRRIYTVEAGEATLTFAAGDSTTGALLGVALPSVAGHAESKACRFLAKLRRA